ncbi:MAG: FAD-dependent monooxygenase, partial [Trebonia sp.]
PPPPPTPPLSHCPGAPANDPRRGVASLFSPCAPPTPGRGPHQGPVSLDWGGTEELDEAFSWAVEPVRASVRLLRRDQCWRMLDRVPLPSWAAERVALLGDAVHPMPAYLAQGACQAIEDAAALAGVLADCPGPHDVAAALAGYQARRAPRASRVSRARQVWESRPLGPLHHRAADDYAASDWLYAPSGPLASADPHWALPR